MTGMMRQVRDIGEFAMIERIARMLPVSPGVIRGIGDDCAVVRVGDRLVLASCDMFIENVHFRRDTASPEDIGWKAAAASVSDIAAMGGAPLFALISLACPADTPVNFVESLYRGMSILMSRFGAVIVGGDTTRCDCTLALDVTILGEAVSGRYLNRRGARPGDLLVCTGPLGLSAAGLDALANHRTATELTHAHRLPRPRVPEGQWLCGQASVHAMIDISDGLLQDAGHLARAGRLGLNILPERLSVAPPLAAYCERYELRPADFILHGGEDYELAFAIAPQSCERALEAFRNEFRTEVAVVGEFSADYTGVRVGGEPAQPGGYDHFREDPPRP